MRQLSERPARRRPSGRWEPKRAVRALASDGATAESCYRESIDRQSRTRLQAYLARVHLLYGEFLRREKRRTEARQHLRRAVRDVGSHGRRGFRRACTTSAAGDRGDCVRKRTVTTVIELTAQEVQIARLDSEGGPVEPRDSTRLFISPRTVEWHMRKVFTKLDISSRRQLRGPLPVAIQRALQI